MAIMLFMALEYQNFGDDIIPDISFVMGAVATNLLLSY